MAKKSAAAGWVSNTVSDLTIDKYYLKRQIEKAWVESQPIVTNEATLQLTIPALIKSSTKDLKLKSVMMRKGIPKRVNLTKHSKSPISFVPVGFPA